MIYVNFAPYENTGNIRDFILESYDTVAIFSFNFHRLTRLEQSSTLSVYRRKNRVFQARLFQTPFFPSFAFILLPIRSLVIFLQILFHTLRIKRRFGPLNDFFTVNAFIAWTGIVLKKLGLVKRTIFWVWDYYPPKHKSRMVTFMRWMYWYFDKEASKDSDRVVYVNERTVHVRKRLHVLHDAHKSLIVPVGTDPHVTSKRKNRFTLVFLGVLKQSQGLDLFFKSLPYLSRYKSRLSLHIIGGGPDESYYRRIAAASDIPVYFHGYQPSELQVDRILASCGIGIAPYVPDPSNVSYWGDPSKIKRYLSAGIPVITTNVFEFATYIRESGCGIVIPYTPAGFAGALQKILARYPQYCRAARSSARRYNYRKVYRPMFE